MTTKPIVAIGGLSVANAAEVVAEGAAGLAVISEWMKAERPDNAARALLAAMRRPSAR